MTRLAVNDLVEYFEWQGNPHAKAMAVYIGKRGTIKRIDEDGCSDTSLDVRWQDDGRVSGPHDSRFFRKVEPADNSKAEQYAKELLAAHPESRETIKALLSELKVSVLENYVRVTFDVPVGDIHDQYSDKSLIESINWAGQNTLSEWLVERTTVTK